MIRLSSAHTLQAVLAGAIATAQPRAVVSFSDKTTTAYIGNTSLTALNSTTPVTICAAPDVGTVRDIDHINVTNADTAAVTLTVRINTDFPVITITLQPGESVEYTHGSGWQLVSTNSITEADVVAIADAQIAAHVALADPHAQYTLETVTATLDTGLRMTTLASTIPGFITEFQVTDPDYPYYTDQNYTFRLIRLNATTLRILRTGPIFFTTNIFNPGEQGIRTFAQQDIDLATLSLPGDGIYVLYVNIDEAGVLTYTNTSLADSPTVVQLGLIAVKQVSLVNSFLDDVPSPVKTMPNLAAVDNLARSMHHLAADIPLKPNAGGLTFERFAGSISGECINWGGAGNVHTLTTAAQNPCQFFRVSPANVTTLGTATTLIDPTQYWNGTALVTVGGGTNNSTVQRILVTITGGILVQYGETIYSDLATASANLTYAPFSDLLPASSFIELARVAIRHTATDLTDVNYSRFVLAGGEGSGGGTGAGGVTDGDKGDITVTSAGTVWTIDNDAVTYAKIQNVSATDKLLGRSTAGAGDVEEITCTAAGRALLDDADAAAQRATLGLGSVDNTSDATKNSAVATLTNKTLNLANNTITGTKAQFDAACSDGDFAYLAQANTFTAKQTIGNDLELSGIGRRITGDFSNATVANRVMFQTSTVNGYTTIHSIPNGTGNTTTFSAESDSTVTNGSMAQFGVYLGAEARFTSGIRGIGTYLPMTFYTGGAERMRIDPTTGAVSGANIQATSGPDNSPFSFRNKFINGDMRIDQRNAGSSQTITAAAALAYTVDRWYGYCTGANVTGQRVAGTAPNQYNYRYTGAASVTKIGHAQRIEAANCQDLAGTTATLAVDLANSLLTTVTWTAWYANTADTFGTLASPTRTQIATGTFTVTSTLTRYSTSISIPSGATTGIEVEFSVGAQTSGTWTIGRVQLESGSVATPFERRPYGAELALCQRYYQVFGGSANNYAIQGYTTAGNNVAVNHVFPVPMRATPIVTLPTMANSNTVGAVANGPNAYGFLLYATATVTGAVASQNTTGGTGNANAEL